MRVVASADGNCPSCHKPLVNAKVEPVSTASAESALTDVDRSLGRSLPQPQEMAWQSADNTTTHFDLFWVLFALRGRIPRSIFWLASIGAPVMFYLVFLFAKALLNETTLLGWIALAIYCALIWSSIAIAVKRLHDLNWTGWLVLIGMIPGIGQLFMLFTAGMMRGTTGVNNYGPDPLELLK
jgi:uncharacterized membrane protein YhaH (DUF805 family)